MSASKFEIQDLMVGPNCYECHARTSCPAMRLIDDIANLNEDLSNTGLDPEISIRVQGEVFAYGIYRINSEVTDVQDGINGCLGPVTIEQNSRTSFVYPSFGENVPGRQVMDDRRTLIERGFRVEADENGIYSVEDLESKLSSLDIGYTENGGLRGTIKSFRNAASFIIKTK